MNDNLDNLIDLDDAREARDRKSAKEDLICMALFLEQYFNEDHSFVGSTQNFATFVMRFWGASKEYYLFYLVDTFGKTWSKCESLGVFENMNPKQYDQLKRLKNRVDDFAKLKDAFDSAKQKIILSLAAIGVIGTGLYVAQEKNFWPFDNKMSSFGSQDDLGRAWTSFIKREHTTKNPDLRVNLLGRHNLEGLKAEDLEKLFDLENRFLAMNESGDNNFKDVFSERDTILQPYGIKVVWFYSADQAYAQFWYLGERDAKNTLEDLCPNINEIKPSQPEQAFCEKYTKK